MVCAGGLRSGTACSILKMNGFTNIYNILEHRNTQQSRYHSTAGLSSSAAFLFPFISGQRIMCLTIRMQMAQSHIIG